MFLSNKVNEQTLLSELELAYRLIPSGLCLLDSDFRCLRVNPRLASWHGRSAEEHVGHLLAEIVPEVFSQLEPTLRRVRDSGNPETDLEVNTRTTDSEADGRRFYSCHPLISEEDSVEAICLVVTTIPGRLGGEARPDDPAASPSGAFAPALAELFRPLTAIVSNAQTARRLLEATPLNEDEIQQVLVEIADEGNRAAGLVRRIESLMEGRPSEGEN